MAIVIRAFIPRLHNNIIRLSTIVHTVVALSIVPTWRTIFVSTCLGFYSDPKLAFAYKVPTTVSIIRSALAAMVNAGLTVAALPGSRAPSTTNRFL